MRRERETERGGPERGESGEVVREAHQAIVRHRELLQTRDIRNRVRKRRHMITTVSTVSTSGLLPIRPFLLPARP